MVWHYYSIFTLNSFFAYTNSSSYSITTWWLRCKLYVLAKIAPAHQSPIIVVSQFRYHKHHHHYSITSSVNCAMCVCTVRPPMWPCRLVNETFITQFPKTTTTTIDRLIEILFMERTSVDSNWLEKETRRMKKKQKSAATIGHDNANANRMTALLLLVNSNKFVSLNPAGKSIKAIMPRSGSTSSIQNIQLIQFFCVGLRSLVIQFPRIETAKRIRLYSIPSSIQN